ncbi:hypothetical protein V1525DRAFT_393836 [Lipomyces kononenkoae]|uniref:Uncharacterized protein n=1 Tax=Lipomyces kononenkoae TaxID=34357 RepID=A0ACC3TB12_LIPKO
MNSNSGHQTADSTANISSASSSSTSLSSAMSHPLLTPNTSDPPTPYFYPTSTTATSSGPQSQKEYPLLRTPLPSPTGSPSPETVYAKMMMRHRRLEAAELQQQTKTTDDLDIVDDFNGESHLEMPLHVRQSPDLWRVDGDQQDYHDSYSHFTTTATDDHNKQYGNDYMIGPQPQPLPLPLPPQSLRDFGTSVPDMQVDLLAEAAKRAEMEILAAEINEMQF